MFARTMNLWLLRQYPSEAHRNRIDQLVSWLNRETLRRQVRGEPCRVLSLGCGPAHEIQRFLGTGPLADGIDVQLIDMNDETLEHVGAALEELKLRHGRHAIIRTRKRSVLGLLRDASRSSEAAVQRQDFIYCAGLFDYLTDAACRQLLKACWDWLAPGGKLVATNVDSSRPFRHMLEFLLDWHLNYRDRTQMLKLVPPEIPKEVCGLSSDPTGVNLYLEIRRPEAG
jgi:extracellular factor (EF) 3-hydroxypalmitic acid methyl ester biosynthesis protein